MYTLWSVLLLKCISIPHIRNHSATHFYLCVAKILQSPVYSIHVEQNFYFQVTPPESMTPRYYHSITATSLGPGLTEVLVFGGHREWGGNDLAETTILRFGEQLLVHAAIATILSDRHVHTRRGWS